MLMDDVERELSMSAAAVPNAVLSARVERSIPFRGSVTVVGLRVDGVLITCQIQNYSNHPWRHLQPQYRLAPPSCQYATNVSKMREIFRKNCRETDLLILIPQRPDQYPASRYRKCHLASDRASFHHRVGAETSRQTTERGLGPRREDAFRTLSGPRSRSGRLKMHFGH